MTSVEIIKSEKSFDEIPVYVLKSQKVEVGIISYGAAILYLKVPDKNGYWDDIVTGFDSLSDYTNNRTYFGATVGRVANRIGNGKFVIDGKEYNVPVNNGPNALHGGINGFDKKHWDGKIEDNAVVMRFTSPDNDEGYPGQLNVTITYKLNDNELSIDYKAETNKPTPVNITNHSFFNLGGHNKWNKDLSNHEITIPASHYLPADENCLVTGEVASTEGTVFDLQTPKLLTEDLLSQVPPGLGFDHNFCLDKNKKRHLAAVLKHKINGRTMTVETTEPGVQFYTGNFLAGLHGKQNVSYTKHSALCLECQNWPDAVNHPGVFPDCLLRPGEVYSHTSWFTFDSN